MNPKTDKQRKYHNFLSYLDMAEKVSFSDEYHEDNEKCLTLNEEEVFAGYLLSYENVHDQYACIVEADSDSELPGLISRYMINGCKRDDGDAVLHSLKNCIKSYYKEQMRRELVMMKEMRDYIENKPYTKGESHV